MNWNEARRNPELYKSVVERLPYLASMTYAQIIKQIQDDFEIKIDRGAIKRILGALDVEKRDCRTVRYAHLRTQEGQESRRQKYRDRHNAYERGRRQRALLKLGNGVLKCAHCGCPHPKALTVGHYNGDIFRRQNKALTRWILRVPPEEAQKQLRLECNYCNFYHGIHKVYPPPEELPTWPSAREAYANRLWPEQTESIQEVMR